MATVAPTAMSTATRPTTMTIHTIMPTDPVLILSQWFSPAYPLGSFAYSHGLETAIQDRRITNATHLEEWLGDVLEHGSGRTDAVLLHAAHGCGGVDDVLTVDAQARAYAASAERLMESAQQGFISKPLPPIWCLAPCDWCRWARPKGRRFCNASRACVPRSANTLPVTGWTG